MNYIELLQAKVSNSFLGAFTPDEYDALAAAIAALKFQDSCKPKDEAAERDHVRYVIERCAEAGGSFDALVMRERAAVRAECASTMGDLRWIIKQRDEQLTDAERLQSQIDHFQGALTCAEEKTHVLQTKLTAAQSEIANLQQSLKSYDAGHVRELEAEIERLTSENRNLIDQEVGGAMQCWQHERDARLDERAKCAAWLIQLTAAQAEIERQQEHVADFQRTGHELETRLSAAQAEIERANYTVRRAVDRAVEAETKLSNLRTASERHVTDLQDGDMNVLSFIAAIEASR